MIAHNTARLSAMSQLYILTAILFVVYLCVAIPLSIIPVYTTSQLGLSNIWAGLGVGASFLTTIVTRSYGGKLVDIKGAKFTVVRGLFLYAIGGALCVASGVLADYSIFAYLLLIAGRFIIGVGESFAGVGVISWGIAFVGPTRSGKVLSLVGAAMYGALAAGGPLGLFLFNLWGFQTTMLISMGLPILGLLAVSPLTNIEPMAKAGERHSFREVIGQIWRHGSVIGLQGIGFAAIGAFFVLYFLDHGWQHAGWGLTAFGSGYVLVRILFGHLPDKIGGLRVALFSLMIEVIGQCLIWQSSEPTMALLGAFFTGLGCSMLYPSMGREVVHIVAPQMRGTALGAFGAFQDIAYGLTGPLAGFLADTSGYNSVFFVGTIAASGGLMMTISLFKYPAKAAAH